MQPPPKWEVVLVYKAMCTGVESLLNLTHLSSGLWTPHLWPWYTLYLGSGLGEQLVLYRNKPYLKLRLELVVAWDRSARSHPSTLQLGMGILGRLSSFLV